jgi:hypothetical protein
MPIFGPKKDGGVDLFYNTNQARLFQEGFSKQTNRVEETRF